MGDELQKKLSASQATWKVVFGHHPVYNKGRRHHTEGRLLRDQYGLDDCLTSGGAQAYFCGHEHNFQHHRCKGIDHFGCGASGAEYAGFYRGLGGSTAPGWFDEGAQAGYVEVSLTSCMMTVSFVAATGSIIQTVQRPLCVG